MRLLTATREGQGERDDDHCNATEGELVILDDVYAPDLSPDLGGPSRGRAFSGLRSNQATTTALVRELQLTRADLELAIATRFAADGLTAEVLGDLGFAELFIGTVDDAIRFGTVWPEGTVVRRTLDGVTIR